MAAAPPVAAGRTKGLLKEKLELEKVRGRDGSTRVTLKPIDDELTFDKGFYVFIRALQLLRSHNEGAVLVGLGGASGSGKTAFSAKVKDFMPGIVVISMDNYNDASKLVDGNFDDPRLTDYDLLLSNLADLKQGKPAEVPIYDFKQSRRVGFNTVPVPESRVIIIEGIYALSERLRPLLDLRVSIAGGVHFDLVKRVLRDISRSGQGPEEIIQQITDTVFPMYKAFIEPDLRGAQLKIHNSFNPFTGFMNATYILKSQRPATLTQAAVVAVLGEGAVVKTEAEVYDIHLLPPAEDPETCASWLRMRNRDGRYTLMFEEWVTEGDFIISPRIQFEVSVRVLGGLMSLGYEIGTIMRRTSNVIAAPGGELTVKLDDVEQLGKFVQVQGKERDRVAATASALGLSDFVPRSYIESVQLSKLTQDFQITDDIKKRFSVNGSSVLDDLYGTSPSTPGGLLGDYSGLRGTAPGSGGRIALSSRAALAGRFAAAGRGRPGSSAVRGNLFGPPRSGPPGDAGGEGLLSCSAPVRGSVPIAIQGPRAPGRGGGSFAAAGSAGAAAALAGGGGGADGSAAASPGSSAAAAAGSTVGGHSIASSEAAGSLPGSLDDGPAASAAAAAAAAALALAAAASSGRSGAATPPGMPQPPSAPGSGGGAGGPGAPSARAASAKGNGLLGQQLRSSSRNTSSGSLPSLDASGAPEAQQQAQQRSAGGGADALAAESLLLLRRLGEEVSVLAEGFRRHSGMQLHLDALTHQYKQLTQQHRHLDEGIAALEAATRSLAAAVQQLQLQPQPAPPPGGDAGLSLGRWLPGSGSGGAAQSAALLAAGAALGAVAGALLLRAGR